jgi:hypothetical protein
VWSVWTHAPLVGADLRVIRDGAAAIDQVAVRALPPVVRLAEQVRSLRHGTTIDVAALRRDAPGLTEADDAVQQAAVEIHALPAANLSAVREFRAKLVTSVDRLARQSRALSTAARVGPSMLGADGRRTYLVAVQNDAESRALGGIVSAFAILTADKGHIHLDRVGSDADLPESPTPVESLPADLQTRYGSFGLASDWRNVTMTPDAPTAAQIVLRLWAREMHRPALDGVIFVDPLVLADILAATGPVPGPHGLTLTSGNVVKLVLVDYYRYFPLKAARSEAFTASTRAVFTAVQQGRGSLPKLVERLGHAVVTGHLAVYSAHADEQQALSATPVTGALPSTAAPFLQVVTQDVGASKLSVYLQRSITYSGGLAPQKLDLGTGAGPVPLNAGTLTVTLHSTVPTSGLPDYVVLRKDALATPATPRGQMLVYVSVYVGHAGQLLAAKQDGRPISMSSQTEKGLSVFSRTVALDPGATTTLTLGLEQPTAVGAALVYRQQPVARPDIVTVTSR